MAWPADEPYPELVRRLDPAVPAQAALLQAATGLSRGAGYTLIGGPEPRTTSHFAVAASYAHATAPLRRLQDRFVSECCLTGGDPPAWVRDGLPALPAAMATGGQRAGRAERAVLDLVEALVLQGREGETFDAVVVDDGLVALADPAVRARIVKGPEPGTRVTVRLEAADPAQRLVTFALA